MFPTAGRPTRPPKCHSKSHGSSQARGPRAERDLGPFAGTSPSTVSANRAGSSALRQNHMQDEGGTGPLRTTERGVAPQLTPGARGRAERLVMGSKRQRLQKANASATLSDLRGSERMGSTCVGDSDLFGAIVDVAQLSQFDIAFGIISPERLEAFSACLSRVVRPDSESFWLIANTCRQYVECIDPWSDGIRSVVVRASTKNRCILAFRHGDDVVAPTPIAFPYSFVLNQVGCSPLLSNWLAWTFTSNCLVFRSVRDRREAPPVGTTRTTELGGLGQQTSDRPTERTTREAPSTD